MSVYVKKIKFNVFFTNECQHCLKLMLQRRIFSLVVVDRFIFSRSHGWWRCVFTAGALGSSWQWSADHRKSISGLRSGGSRWRDRAAATSGSRSEHWASSCRQKPDCGQTRERGRDRRPVLSFCSVVPFWAVLRTEQQGAPVRWLSGHASWPGSESMSEETALKFSQTVVDTRVTPSLTVSVITTNCITRLLPVYTPSS